jgi:hypothetical protein
MDLLTFQKSSLQTRKCVGEERRKMLKYKIEYSSEAIGKLKAFGVKRLRIVNPV